MATSASHNGEGSSRGSQRGATLGEIMSGPSTAPDVVVLDRLPDELEEKEVLDPEEDLWLTTADGRYNSPIIPIRVGVGSQREEFYVHKNILLKSEWFRKALCGGFLEATTQSLDLPDEKPAIFHFVVAYLYEDRYEPTRSLSSVLVPDEDKGKGREDDSESSDDSDSDSSVTSLLSNSTARSRQRRDRHRRRTEREADRLRQKHPGMHRPQCTCPRCFVRLAPCVSCGFTPRVARPVTPPPPPPAAPRPGPRSHRHRRRGQDGRPAERDVSLSRLSSGPSDRSRISAEDMSTWLMAYELNIDVYICADKYLLDDFKPKIARVVIDMLETAGPDAAEVEVLRLCARLWDGVSESDALLRMVFARVGFLQSTMWRRAPAETNGFLVENPEIGALILKEMAMRGETDLRSAIPSMERNYVAQSPVPPGGIPHYRPHHPYRHRILY